MERTPEEIFIAGVLVFVDRAKREESLRKFLYPRCMKKARTIVEELDKEVSAFISQAPQADDITVLVAEIA